MVQTRQSDNPPDVAEIIAQQLQNIISNIVTQVTNNLKGFVACGPRDFDGTGGAVALTRWIEKMESVIDNSRCLANQRVKSAASSFIGKALTWWNTQVQAREFCPSNEIEKLEGELWNHLMVGANHAGYTDQFHELAKLIYICFISTKFAPILNKKPSIANLGYVIEVANELFSDYECEIKYHPGKANVVADALNRKERVKPRRVRTMAMTSQSGVKGLILTAQGEAFKDENVIAEGLNGTDQQREKKENGSLHYMDRIWVSLVGGVRTKIMDEDHKTRYSVHHRADKM
ncbi:hypothetical protein Tco_1257499, partial [Tanacetum coccineum]